MSHPATQPVAIPTAARAPADVILRATNVHRAFRMGDQTVTVLRGADLTLRRGEFVAIEGRSGSGKSTLLHILGALEGLDAGSLAFEGQEYARLNADKQPRGWRHWTWRGWLALALVLAAAVLLALMAVWLSTTPALRNPGRIRFLSLAFGGTVIFLFALGLARVISAYFDERPTTDLRNRSFGFVFQFYHLLPELSVLENTMLASMVDNGWFAFLGKRAALRTKATDLLTSLGLAHRLTHRPSQLSGGERQRVAIARALMNDPQVLFADEPTGNLDYDTGRQIMAVLEKLHKEKGQTIVMVTHDRALAREADRVLVLKNGKLEKAE
ncbi:MAG TPA: ABC transporter ATP-binding protein [Tepidisphaeraceae bacterium]|nr:ABC transporter ATP-binding protein [Tepidisphaeraceae bacterium]